MYPEYQTGPHTFNHRLAMCEAVGECEGSEIGDALSSLCVAINTLNGIGEDHNAALCLLAAENISREYVDWLRYECENYKTYEAFPQSVMQHFTDGANKLTKEEWEQPSWGTNNAEQK